MIRMPVGKLESGMILAAPVRNPVVGKHVLLHAGYCLEVPTIARVQRLGIEAVWIRHPSFDFLDEKLGDEIPRCRAKLYNTVKQSFSGIASKTSGAFDLIEYRTIIGNMIMAIVANKGNAVCAQRIMEGNAELFSHCSNVAYLSLVIGMRIKDYIFAQRKYVNYRDGADLTNLGIGAMIHDIGKLGLDKKWHDVHWFEKHANSDDYRSHAERGYRAVQGRVEATAATIVLYHHQRFNGQRVPQPKVNHQGPSVEPMEGARIHIFTRIVAVANAIDGLISACQNVNAPKVTALSVIQHSRFDGVFDPLVLDAALRTIPPFPLGACVELSDGRQAVVIDLKESKPCQPKVGLLHGCHNENGATYKEVDLAAPEAPAIVKIGDQVVNPGVFYTMPESPDQTYPPR